MAGLVLMMASTTVGSASVVMSPRSSNKPAPAAILRTAPQGKNQDEGTLPRKEDTPP